MKEDTIYGLVTIILIIVLGGMGIWICTQLKYETLEQISDLETRMIELDYELHLIKQLLPVRAIEYIDSCVVDFATLPDSIKRGWDKR